MRTKIPEALLEALLENPYESLILVDADGVVRFMSSSNEGVYPVSVNDAIGKHISEVSPETCLPRILETGKAEFGRSMILKSKNRIIARIPLMKEGRVIGAAGKVLIRSPEKLKELYERIENLETKVDYFKRELDQLYGGRHSFDSIIGTSSAIRKAKALARQAAKTDAAIILTGESGTGKELFAHSIHQASRRRKQNFVRVNCAAIPVDLIEAQMFGYEAGAFTGARKQGMPGKFELAHKGTIFLDEIGDMPMALQVKLMRVLEDKEVERIGAHHPKPIDFRVISATNRSLKKLIDAKAFRLDLFYRLNVVHIHLPPLRELRDDLPALVHHLLARLSVGERPRIRRISKEALAAIQQYHWPGNVRELRNVIERAMIVSRNNVIETEDLPLEKIPTPKAEETAGGRNLPLKALMAETERQAIARALALTAGNRVKAAEMLGIHRTGLYQKMKKHGLS